jgi:hypothetical protein
MYYSISEAVRGKKEKGRGGGGGGVSYAGSHLFF